MTRHTYLLGAMTLVLSAGIMLALGFSKVPLSARGMEVGAEAPAEVAGATEAARAAAPSEVVKAAPVAAGAMPGFGFGAGQPVGFGAPAKAAATQAVPPASSPATRRYSRRARQG